MAPLALIAVAFSISNRLPVTLELWPFPFIYEVPVYIAVLGGGAIGFLMGGFIAWVSGAAARAQARSQARSQTRRAENAERELAELNEKLENQEAAPRKQILAA